MATLEQLSAALVKADAAGNAADAKAFADAIRQMKQTPLQLVTPATEQGIPGTVRPAEPDAPRSLFKRAMGNIETIPAMVGGAVGGVVAPIAQLGHELTQGQAFTPQGKAAAAKFGQEVQGQFYQPRTPEAQRNLQAIGEAVIPLAGLHLGGPVNSLAPATRAIGDVARSEGSLVSGAAGNALANRSAKIQAANVATSYERAPIIEGAQAAERQGLVVNPAVTNPTKLNKLKSAVVGPEFDALGAKHNAEQTTKVVRKDLGIAPEEKLNITAFDKALDKASAPYAPIREMPVLQVSDDVLASIRSLDKPATLGGKAQAKVVSTLIDDVTQELQAGRSGEQIIDDIRQMRRNAQSVYKARDSGSNPPPADIAQADARMGIANALEKLIDENAPNAQTLKEFQQARKRMAQIYDHERATNFANETVNPQVYAKLLDERKGNMTGVGADIGKVAATFPNLMTTQIPSAQAMPKITRSGIAAAGGAMLGGSIAGYEGAILGAATGAGIGSIGSKIASKSMIKPEYQAKHAHQIDYRPAPNNLRPAELNMDRTNALVPYDYLQSTFKENEIPNWQFGRSDVNPKITPTGVNIAQPQIGMSKEKVGGQMGALRAEDVRLYQQQAIAEANAQTAAEIQAATTRKTARGEIQFDLDPITGKLVPTSSTLKGATPNINVIESTGHSLKNAANKVASGKLFDMSSEERIAWNKTKVDFADADPQLKGMNDKQIANKIMDRQWVDATVKKLKEQDAAFAEMYKKAEKTKASIESAKQRELLIEKLEELQDQFSKPRKVELGGQGPKTRAAKASNELYNQRVNNINSLTGNNK